MTDLAKTLTLVRTKLDEGADEAALEGLLAAWLATREVRIAETIDRVSERITAARDPIVAKSVKQRTATWMAIAEKKDAADVGRLLATPWPGTWKHAVPVLEALLWFGDDPRIAMAFAKLVEATPYDTWTSDNFYRPLVAYLVAANDVRTLPILERDLEREKSSYWRQSTRHRVAGAVAALKKTLPVALAKDEDEALAAVEAVFAAVTTEAKSRAKGDAELLAAIYEAPDDDGPRAVYADWLVERGDPRGELVNLQLSKQGKSGADLDAVVKRETALIKKHGKAWAGALDHVLAKHRRVFERGFLAAGVLAIEGRPETPPKVFEDPAWATFHTLELDWEARYYGIAVALLSLPSMRWLRALHALDEEVAAALATMDPRPRVEEISFVVDWHDDEEGRAKREARRKVIADGAAFTGLRRLALDVDPDQPAQAAAIATLLRGALAKRLERISVLHHDVKLGELRRIVEAEGLAIPELATETPHGAATQWAIVLRRDDRGRLTKLSCETSELVASSAIVSALAQLPDVTELVVVPTKTEGYSEREIRRLEDAIASCKELRHVDVPWERLTSEASRNKGAGPPLWLTVVSDGLASSAALPTLWKMSTEPPLSLRFDSYSVNYGAHTALPADAIAFGAKLLDKKRTTTLKLYAKGSGDERFVELHHHFASIASDEAPGVDALIAWLLRMLDALPIASANMPFVGRDEDGWTRLHDQPRIPPIGMFAWIKVLGEKDATDAQRDAIAKLGGSKDLPWLRTAATKRHAILVAGPSPAHVPANEEREALAQALARIFPSEPPAT